WYPAFFNDLLPRLCSIRVRDLLGSERAIHFMERGSSLREHGASNEMARAGDLLELLQGVEGRLCVFPGFSGFRNGISEGLDGEIHAGMLAVVVVVFDEAI